MAASKKAFDLSDELRSVATEAAASFGVSPNLSECDQLLGYILQNEKGRREDAIKAYFAGGRNDANAVVSAVKESGNFGNGKRILEFASGFGRVSRHLIHLLPDNNLTSSDIHDDACALMRGFGIKAVVSAHNPTGLRLEERYDFIFVLSLFSHLPDISFGSWIFALYNHLAPGGSLLFTTHGEAAMRRHQDYFSVNFDSSKGFGYRPESDQQDLASSEYGTTTVTMPYVYKQILEHAPGAIIKSFRSETWFGLQDEWVIQRPSGSGV